jgi:hypothetical protein
MTSGVGPWRGGVWGRTGVCVHGGICAGAGGIVVTGTGAGGK